MRNKKTIDTLWGGHLSAPPAEENVLFCSGRDVRPVPEADRELLPFDLWVSEVHGLMLYRAGILTKSEIRSLFGGFDHLRERIADGDFVFDPAKEDVHTHIEAFLTETCGPEVGGKIHTGRSRNDQAACAMRLYLRANLLAFYRKLLGLLRVLLRLAREHATTAMPGLTHRQYGTVSTYGYLLTAYAQALVRDLERLSSTYDRINQCPLGAAAGYGTSWPIDRNMTAEFLAFDGVERNALDAVGTRWEAEADLVADLSFFMNHASQIAAGRLRDGEFDHAADEHPRLRRDYSREIGAGAGVSDLSTESLAGCSERLQSGIPVDQVHGDGQRPRDVRGSGDPRQGA